jgi:hypothetical protein
MLRDVYSEIRTRAEKMNERDFSEDASLLRFGSARYLFVCWRLNSTQCLSSETDENYGAPHRCHSHDSCKYFIWQALVSEPLIVRVLGIVIGVGNYNSG